VLLTYPSKCYITSASGQCSLLQRVGVDRLEVWPELNSEQHFFQFTFFKFANCCLQDYKWHETKCCFCSKL